MSKEDLLYYTQIAVQFDLRLQVCTLYLKEGVWSHDERRCPKCIAYYIINEME